MEGRKEGRKKVDRSKQKQMRTANAQQMHNKCTTNAQQMHTKCTTNAPQMHNKCTTNAQQMHNKCTTNAQQMHNNAFTAPPQVDCDRCCCCLPVADCGCCPLPLLRPHEHSIAPARLELGAATADFRWPHVGQHCSWPTTSWRDHGCRMCQQPPPVPRLSPGTVLYCTVLYRLGKTKKRN